MTEDISAPLLRRPSKRGFSGVSFEPALLQGQARRSGASIG
jgi:hypothetical protein